MTLAKAQGVPAYVIFDDRSLTDMAARRPRDLDERPGALLAEKGVD